ncbi:uncharacterized protein N7458_007345 [Penicillium daleae]|uniref:EXPERA domain-containing protein n=1 Tax=Penicillium daleae TaxID=63821 RepID=A0AAD6G0S4_9EURO|nr:uncharacterized protein N7458_007345 [Penicillium daleae]KAJ5443473.1 hypothetical protein N7458_007345 [Penicillium daleae]
MAPLTTRKRDLAYLLFFTTHLPIIFLVDTVPLQPAWLRTDLSAQLREYYVATYRDKFFEDPAPVWFSAFVWMELVYHVPASLWAVWGLIRVHLLIFGIQAFVTSLTCLIDVWSWPDRTTAEKQQITYLYGPYVALEIEVGSVELSFDPRARHAAIRNPSNSLFSVTSFLQKITHITNQTDEHNTGALMAFDMVLRLRARLMPKAKRE